MNLKLNIKKSLIAVLSLTTLSFAETYEVQKGDTIEKISKKFSVSQEEILKANNIKDPRKLKAGDKIEIPTKKSQKEEEKSKKSKKEASSEDKSKEEKSSKNKKESSTENKSEVDLSKCEIYEVKRGGRLENVTKRTGVPVEKLEKLNNLDRNSWLKAGTKICIARKSEREEKESRENLDIISSCDVIYNPKSDTSLKEIARRFKVSVSQLKKLNNLKSDKVKAGQIICIESEELSKKVEKKPEKDYVIYKVKRGDTLQKIADKFNVSPQDILEENNLKSEKSLKAGERIKIPIEVSKKTAEEKPEKNNLPEKPEKVEKTPQAEKLPPQTKPKEEEVSLPTENLFIWPVKGDIIAKFENSEQVRHLGVDIKTECKKDVVATYDGKVIYTGDNVKGFGNIVVIRHENGFTTVYGYLDDIDVKIGQRVKKGDVIGKTGKIKDSDMCGLYFEVRKGITPIDPLAVLPK